MAQTKNKICILDGVVARVRAPNKKVETLKWWLKYGCLDAWLLCVYMRAFKRCATVRAILLLKRIDLDFELIGTQVAMCSSCAKRWLKINQNKSK